MSDEKAAGKTIGDVEKITGIPKRELKYFLEQKIMKLSHRTESGYWLYSNEDIKKAQLAFLCRELDFPVGIIRTILADPPRYWQEELEQQIIRLAAKRDCAETQLTRAESLRLNWKTEEWADLIQRFI